MKDIVIEYAVTYIECGDGTDGRPRCLGVYKSRDMAVKALEADMKTYAKSIGGESSSFDWKVWKEEDDEERCVWNINEVEVEAKES